MDLKLNGLKALITGSSKGIGAACAESLAREGCSVVLVARDGDALNAVSARLAAFGGMVIAEPADLADSRNVDRLAAAHGDVDILVNNAGAIPAGHLHEIDEATWRRAWDLKVFGYINMCRRFYAAMQVRRRGVIINIIGSAGKRVDSSYIAGSTGNAALIAFTEALGSASAADGIRVVGINPGPVATERHEAIFRRRAELKLGDGDRWRELLVSLPFGRAGLPDEIGAMAAFLSSVLSSYTSGDVITIDGGAINRRAS
ncbi:short-chain dehydrogenase/reductase [Bradyrhizobium sp. 6(2017)]|uniref:short-chain dehydrogenase/reductase n=1 Tax=Bradyrhizobium sp. 6(2017) TaxID=1197460 RepID=UPI0013E0F0C1|nr:short-chain dehydrogenase/reductase [Bradyrhizobium sp. 6(2017)]QIG97674.1 SDR family oxidoreductase [Bradyrhizobium sp. 6(2017)]